MRRVSSCWPLISSTRLDSLSSWLCCLRKRSRRRSRPWSSATRQTALSRSRLRDADVGDVLAQRGLEPGDQPLQLDVAQRLLGACRLGVALHRRQVDIAAGQRAQRVALVVLDLLQPELVDRVVEQQHLDALGQRLLELRAGAQRVVALAADVVDRVLAFLHPGGVVGEADPALAGGAVEAGEVEQLAAIVGVLVQAFLEHGAELAPPAVVAFGLGLASSARVGLALGGCRRLGLGGELVEQAAHQRLAHLGDDGTVLQRLAADVELQILAVDHAADEAQVARQQRVEIGGDEHAADVELHPVPALRVVQVEGTRARDEQQCRVGECPLGREMHARERLVEGVRDVVVELLVLVLGDLALGPGPDGTGLVDLLRLGEVGLGVAGLGPGLQDDRQADMVGVGPHDLPDLPAVEEFLGLGLQVQGHRGAARRAGRRLLHRVAAAAVRRPQPALVGAGLAALDDDPVGHHEHRIEADAELADQLEVLVLLAGQLAQELGRARAGDRAQVLDQVVPVHADAVVADGQQALGLVGQDADLELGIVAQQLGLAQGLVAQLVARVGRVADQLAQEDLTLLVERVDDQIEHTADIGLERLHGLGHDGVAVPICGGPVARLGRIWGCAAGVQRAEATCYIRHRRRSMDAWVSPRRGP